MAGWYENCIFAILNFEILNNSMKLKFCLFVLFCGLMCACRAPKDVVYFQGIDEVTPERLAEMSQTYTTKITNDDLLSINVTAWDPAAVTPFNPPVFAYSTVPQGEQPITASQNLYTYLVDQEGYINFPVLGKVHASGLTRQELANKMEEMISKYVENPLVNVQLLNFKITMMGEVSRPGTLSIKNDRVSILDAIGMAGDLQLTANRKNILVIRDNNGMKETHRLDITDPAIFASPYYYLKQNDIVYVEPVKTKQRTRTSSDRSFTMSVLTSLISSVSIITSMVITIVNLNRK